MIFAGPVRDTGSKKRSVHGTFRFSGVFRGIVVETSRMRTNTDRSGWRRRRRLGGQPPRSRPRGAAAAQPHARRPCRHPGADRGSALRAISVENVFSRKCPLKARHSCTTRFLAKTSSPAGHPRRLLPAFLVVERTSRNAGRKIPFRAFIGATRIKRIDYDYAHSEQLIVIRAEN